MFRLRSLCRTLAVVTLAALPLAGCRTPQRDGAESAYSVDRARAAVQLSEEGGPTAIARLVGLLDDPDRTVRWYAIQGLHRLTGETHGYRPFDPPDARRAAVARWREVVREGGPRLVERSATADRSSALVAGAEARSSGEAQP